MLKKKKDFNFKSQSNKNDQTEAVMDKRSETERNLKLRFK